MVKLIDGDVNNSCLKENIAKQNRVLVKKQFEMSSLRWNKTDKVKRFTFKVEEDEDRPCL